MSIDRQVREVLRRFDYGYTPLEGERKIDQALSQIHDLYLEEFGKMLPREIYGSGFDVKGYNQGFNSCIAEIKAKLKEAK